MSFTETAVMPSSRLSSRMSPSLASSASSASTVESEMSLPKSAGISFWMAAIFISGEIAGSGMLTLPYSMKETGWIGIPLLLLLGMLSAYCGLCLSRAWNIVESRYPELLANSQDPFREIAFKALGERGRMLTSVSLCVNTFGICIVYVLMVEELLQSLLPASIPISKCVWLVIIGVCLVPVSWLGTPKDFKFIGVVALSTSTLTWLLTMIQLGSNFDKLKKTAKYSSPSFLTFFFGVGPMLFAFGNATEFPTVQNDMHTRRHFGRSVIMTYACLTVMYVSLAALGHFTLGNSAAPDILDSLKSQTPGLLTSIAHILFIIHLVTAFFVIINPFFQQMECNFRIKNAFSLKRAIFRTLLMGLLVFLAELVPDFVKVLDLLGSTTIALMTFILPPIFYMRLTAMPDPDDSCRTTPSPLWERLLLFTLILSGILGAIACTMPALQNIVMHGIDSSCVIATRPGERDIDNRGTQLR